MSFRENPCQQMSITDSLSNLTPREQKALENSWAKVFADEIFPAIDESRFSVLYSNQASRPNAPVNVIIGALIIKELFDYSDDEIVENLMLDLHMQYALHTTSFEEQPISDKTLSRFRKRCYDYERTHNVDLYRDCVKDLGKKIAKMMGINGRIRRMDSMMIESNIRFLSRMELIYTCISKVCMYLEKTHPAQLTETLKPYADPNDYNRTFYHQRNEVLDEKIQKLLDDSDQLLETCGSSLEDVLEYELFVRCLSEQTVIENGKRRLREKEDGLMNSTMLQNPSDPDATYRNKAGKIHRGYAANIEESVGANGSVVTNYQYEPNIHSDSQFLKESVAETEVSEKMTLLITDGGYGGGDNTELAKSKNIDLITTSLVGTDAPDTVADFQYNADGTKLERCSAGHAPLKCYYTERTKQVKVTFSAEHCQDCPFRSQCNPKMKNGKAMFTTSQNATNRAKHKRRMNEGDFKYYARLRNGIETIPSNIRRNYHLEKLPRGKQRGKFFFGSKIAALNFRKLFGFRKGLGNYALNPLLV